MKVFWRIAYAFAISSALLIKPLQAEENNKQTMKSVSYLAAQQGKQKMAQAEVSDSDKSAIKPAENYKWAIQPSNENYKWALPSLDKTAGSDKPAPLASTKPEAAKKSTSYFKPSSSYSTQPESDPPRYVRNLSKTGIEAFKDINWLDVGLDHRTRYEFRSNDIRRTDLRLDEPFLLRTRGYLGVKEILDPLRGAV